MYYVEAWKSDNHWPLANLRSEIARFRDTADAIRFLTPRTWQRRVEAFAASVQDIQYEIRRLDTDSWEDAA